MPMAWLLEERRIKSRFSMARLVELQTPTGAVHVETRDIGSGGAFVLSTTALAIGSKVKMIFTVPKPNGFPHDFPFHYEGIIVRQHRLADDKFGLAIRWESIEEGM